jgi:hypothetical protein
MLRGMYGSTERTKCQASKKKRIKYWKKKGTSIANRYKAGREAIKVTEVERCATAEQSNPNMTIMVHYQNQFQLPAYQVN